jgi:hypothetical protein
MAPMTIKPTAQTTSRLNQLLESGSTGHDSGAPGVGRAALAEALSGSVNHS